jgi:hypothetical protein
VHRFAVLKPEFVDFTSGSEHRIRGSSDRLSIHAYQLKRNVIRATAIFCHFDQRLACCQRFSSSYCALNLALGQQTPQTIRAKKQHIAPLQFDRLLRDFGSNVSGSKSCGQNVSLRMDFRFR